MERFPAMKFSLSFLELASTRRGIWDRWRADTYVDDVMVRGLRRCSSIRRTSAKCTDEWRWRVWQENSSDLPWWIFACFMFLERHERSVPKRTRQCQDISWPIFYYRIVQHLVVYNWRTDDAVDGETSSPLNPFSECLTSCLGSPIPQTFFNDESEIKKVLQPFEIVQQVHWQMSLAEVAVTCGRDLERRIVNVLFLCIPRAEVLANVQESIVANQLSVQLPFGSVLWSVQKLMLEPRPVSSTLPVHSPGHGRSTRKNGSR